MLSNRLLVSLISFCAVVSAAPSVHVRDNTLAIISLGKNGTATRGTANVAAAGDLSPFGSIGIGKHCSSISFSDQLTNINRMWHKLGGRDVVRR